MELPQSSSRLHKSLFFIITTVMFAVLLVLLVAGGLVVFMQQRNQWKEKNDSLAETIILRERTIEDLRKKLGEKENEPEKEQLTGTYEWKEQALKSLYGAALWTPLTINPLAEFSPKESLIERSTQGCERPSFEDPSFLRVEGGLCRVGYWLEGGQNTNIDSYAKLQQRFGPIDNEREAIAFLAMSLSGLVRTESGEIRGHALPSNIGYLVHLTAANTFGCGNHEPTGLIFTITSDGTYALVASETPPPPRPDTPILCVD